MKVLGRLSSASVKEACESALVCSLAMFTIVISISFLRRKGQQLEPSDKYMFNRMEGGRSMLTIRNIRQSDGGSYTCNADNKAGSQERELFLKVFGKDHGKCWNKVDCSVEKNETTNYCSFCLLFYFHHSGIILLTDKIVPVV